MALPRTFAHRTILGFPLGLVLCLVACTESEQAAIKERAEAPPTDGDSAQPAAKNATKGSAGKTTSEGAVKTGDAGDGGISGAACLAGKWHYDFADNALETMIANLPQGKVTKEAGELVCENTLAKSEGTVTCAAAGGKPVVIEVTANQGGMPLSILVKMSGKTSSKFKLLNDTTMQITSAGLGDLKVEVEATIAGNKIPFPAMPLLESLTGEMGATNSFDCKGDKLRLRPQIEAQTSWQELTRIK